MDNIRQLVWRLFAFHEELMCDFFPFDILSKGYDYCEYWDLSAKPIWHWVRFVSRYFLSSAAHEIVSTNTIFTIMVTASKSWRLVSSTGCSLA